MNEKFIIGKGLTEDEKNNIVEYLEKRKEEGRQKMDGEYEKKQEELKFLSLINSYLQEEIKELGISEFVNLTPDQFHFVSKSLFDELGEDEDFTGVASRFKNNAYINKDIQRHRLEFYHTILHEAVHLCSFERYQFIEKKDGQHLSTYRSGYHNTTIEGDKFGEDHKHFRGFNEAVTDMIVLDILRKHKTELVSELKITKEEENSPVSFSGYKTLLAEIIYKITEKQGGKYEDVWRKIKEGYFTGEMMHLRIVEKVFGKKSIRFLAAVYSGVKDDSLELREKISDYFDTENENEREKIAREVLNERELTGYLKD